MSERPVEFFVEGDSDPRKFAEIPRATLARLVYLEGTLHGVRSIGLHGTTRLSSRTAASLVRDIEHISKSHLDPALIDVALSLLPGAQEVGSRPELSILIKAGD